MCSCSAEVQTRPQLGLCFSQWCMLAWLETSSGNIAGQCEGQVNPASVALLGVLSPRPQLETNRARQHRVGSLAFTVLGKSQCCSPRANASYASSDVVNILSLSAAHGTARRRLSAGSPGSGPAAPPRTCSTVCSPSLHPKPQSVNKTPHTSKATAFAWRLVGSPLLCYREQSPVAFRAEGGSGPEHSYSSLSPWP